ncbi:MAG: DUF998 domain-containing protein [Thermoleophilaceae bacterium]|nr:DUF998 domain-containing protein [Thermoleophilaceae bacterium]
MQAQNHITTVTGTTQTIATFVLLLVAGSIISLVSVHLLDRDVKPTRDAVSDYGAREHAWFYRLTAIWLGFAGLLTAVVMADAIFPKPTLTILALLLFAATRWAITIFPTDLEGEEETPVGHSHTVLAVIAFASIAIAAVTFSFAIADDPFWDASSGLLWALAAFVSIAAAATGIARAASNGYFGLIERLLYVAMYAWISAVALIVLTS